MKHLFPFRVPTLSRSFTILVLGPLLLSLSYVPISSNAHAAAPVTPSGLNTQVSVSPTPPAGTTQYDITEATRPGGVNGTNLFHSFGDFNVPTNNIANFLNSGSVDQNGALLPPNLQTSNILAGVTGVNPSVIFGMIQTTNFGNANLFLMNPYGFLFGPNATVNVGGMMTFTTADYIRLTDGGRFNANPNTMPVDLLTTANVAAFGFLGSNPKSIDFVGGQLTVTEGIGLAFVGGDINLLTPDSSVVPNVSSSITAPGRPILLTSVAGPGEVAADTGIPAEGMTLGTVTLGQGTTLSTVGNLAYGNGSGGAVSIRGGQFVATDARILTNPASGTLGRGGEVAITTTGSAAITNSTIDTTTTDPGSALVKGGDGGAVSVTASDLALTNSSILTLVIGESTAVTPSAGAGGAVTLTGTDSVTLTRSLINTETRFSNGNGGPVTVTSPIVTLEDSAMVTDVRGNGSTPITASSGPVTLGGPETNSVSMTRSFIDTSSSETEGNSGSVTITGQTITIGGKEGGQQTIVTSTNSTSGDPNSGNGGDINITGTNVTFTDLATVESVASSLGTFSRGGNVRINGAQTILLDSGTVFSTATNSQGNSGNIELTSQHVTIRGQSEIASDALGSGDGGTITITGKQNIALESGSQVTTSADPGSDGPAGNIELTTPQLTITGGSSVRSESLVGSGPGGIITVRGVSGPAQSVLISDPGSGIFTDTSSVNLDGTIIGTGAGGNIFVHANSVTLQNGGILSAQTTGVGNAGDILVKADSVSIASGAQIASSSSVRQTPLFPDEVISPPTGNAGNVTIQGLASPAQSVQIDGRGSGISTDTQGTGAGGNILVNANSVTLQNGSSLSATTSGTAPTAIGGTITLHAPHIVLSGGDTLVNASTFGPGNAGDVVLETQSLIMSGVGTQGARVSTITQGPGQGGNITVQGLEGPESAAEVVQLIQSSGLFAQTIFGGTDTQGNAGSIHVRTATLVLDGASQLSTMADDSTGRAGTVIVDATDSVHLGGSSSITSSSAGVSLGQAGDITITSPAIWLKGASFISTSTEFVGNAGNITLHTQALSLTEDSKLTSNSGPQLFPEFPEILSGSAGSVKIQDQRSPAQSVLIDGAGSGIFTDTQGTGAGGNIFVNANSVTLQNGGVLSAVTSGTTATATGGTITVEANQVQLNNGGLITASTTGAGAGGSITIGASGTFTSNASTVSSTATQAQGGDIKITAGQSATLNNGSGISASSTGEGDAGDIDINAGQTFLATNSSVTTQANLASGGTIKITTNPSGTVELTNSLISASVLNGTGGGGSVNIDPLYVLMQNSQILAQAVQGPGGNITINITNGGLFLPDANSTVSASSQFGVNGTVTIQNPNAPAGGQIQPLGKSPLIAASLLNQRCASSAAGEFSSFTVAGRDSLPTEPGSWLASPLALSPAGFTVGTVTMGGDQTHVVDPANKTNLLSLRQIAPAGFLTQAFATDSSTGCS